MSGVLHPVGPEPARTYWLRRALVLGALVVAVAIIIALIVNATKSGQSVGAVPASASPASISPATSPAPTSPSLTSPSPTSPGATSSAPSSSSPSSTATPKPSRSAKPAGPSKSPSAAAVATCDPAQLKTTLTGRERLKPKQHSTFRLSLVNGGPTTCLAIVTGDDLALKIYSGQDRIWSTNDCPTAVKGVKAKLTTQKAVEWTLTWNGLRSAPKCKSRPEIPKPGTYVATAQLSGAKPAQLRMVLVNG